MSPHPPIAPRAAFASPLALSPRPFRSAARPHPRPSLASASASASASTSKSAAAPPRRARPLRFAAGVAAAAAIALSPLGLRGVRAANADAANAAGDRPAAAYVVSGKGKGKGRVGSARRARGGSVAFLGLGRREPVVVEKTMGEKVVGGVRKGVGEVVKVGERLFGAEEGGGGGGGHSAAVNDALVLLGTTVLIVPLMRRLNTSPILGFLAAGIALGPNGFALVRDVATSTALAELGVVFFLFEMGLELSTSKLKSLGTDVFGLGTAQFTVSALLIGGVSLIAGLPAQTAIVVGAALALSSSAFVLQLLGERGEVGTRYGRASFGVLLFQDLAVVPVLVLTPLLAGSGGAAAVMKAISVASAKAAVALSFIVFMGKTVLQPVFRFVAKAQSSEAFIATILFTALGTSALTQGLGLSDTLGAFLAGVMLAETTFRHQVEADIKPFRGLLLGLFFITVGFSIDLQLAVANIGTVASLVFGLLAIKSGVIAAAGVLFGLSTSSALRTGLMLAQGGEFAFVIFGLAQQVGVLPSKLSQLLLLVVALSMALTPTLADLGQRIAARLDGQRGLIGARKEDADTADARDFVMVAGFGRVGQQVCELLDSKLVRYMAFDQSPSRVIVARGKGLPVFFGDATRPEVLKAAGVQRARAVVVTLDDEAAALRAVQNIRREFGDELEIFCRARDAKHQMLLKSAGATAIVPELLEASLLLGGAVLLAYGTPTDEVNSLIQDSRRTNLGEVGTNSGSLNDILGSQFVGGTSANADAEPINPDEGASLAASSHPASDGSSSDSSNSSNVPGVSAAAAYVASTPVAINGSDENIGAVLSESIGGTAAAASATAQAFVEALDGLESIETVAQDDDIYEPAEDNDVGGSAGGGRSSDIAGQPGGNGAATVDYLAQLDGRSGVMDGWDAGSGSDTDSDSDVDDVPT